jgi:carbamate kinase
VAPDPEGLWRRVVPSPRPYSIVEAPVIRQLAESGTIVVGGGGGGVPVIEEGPRLVGVEAVVDKDLCAAILARDVEAEVLLICTDVDGVYRAYGTPEQGVIDRMSVEEVRRGLEDGTFPAGSMGPKVDAAAAFVEAGGRRAVICALDDAPQALDGQAGTAIARS